VVASEPPQPIGRSIRVHFANRGYRRILALGIGFGLFSIGDALAYLVIWDASKDSSEIGTSGFGMEWFPLLFAGTAIAFLATATPLGRLSDRIGRARVWVIGHLFLLAVYAVLLLGPTSTPAVVGVLVLLGLYYGATDGVLPALASGVISPELRSGGLALLATGVAIARMIAAASFGLIWDRFGSDSALIVAGCGLVVVLGTVSTTAVLRSPEPEVNR